LRQPKNFLSAEEANCRDRLYWESFYYMARYKSSFGMMAQQQMTIQERIELHHK
jgi:hypothetical protein